MKKADSRVILIILISMMFILNRITLEQIDNSVSNLSEKIDIKEKDTIFVEIAIPIEEVVTLTTYNPIYSQCDSNPLITADGTKINLEKLSKDEIKYCAVSRDLLEKFPYGSVIYIEGHGEYFVCDTMNERLNKSVDILQDAKNKNFKKENIKIIKIK